MEKISLPGQEQEFACALCAQLIGSQLLWIYGDSSLNKGDRRQVCREEYSSGVGHPGDDGSHCLLSCCPHCEWEYEKMS